MRRRASAVRITSQMTPLTVAPTTASSSRARSPANLSLTARVGRHPPAVKEEEKGDEYAQSEFEEPGAEHRPAGYC